MKRTIAISFLALLSACGGSIEETLDVVERFNVPPDTEPLVAAVKSAVSLAHVVTAAESARVAALWQDPLGGLAVI